MAYIMSNRYNIIPSLSDSISKSPTVTQFLFRSETKTFIVSALLGFASQRFIDAVQDAVTNTAILKSIKAMHLYTSAELPDLIENSSLSNPRYEKVSPTTQLLIAFVQLLMNLFIIYLIYCALERFTPK